jgi:hypothetical protein
MQRAQLPSATNMVDVDGLETPTMFGEWDESSATCDDPECNGSCGRLDSIGRSQERYPIARCDVSWLDLELLLWFRPGSDLPPLVSTGPISVSRTIFGNETVGDELSVGGRITIGRWFDPSHTGGIMLRYFLTEEQDVEFNSTGQPLVARPFIDVTPGSPAFGAESALFVNSPSGPTGDVSVQLSSNLTGGDVIFRWLVHSNECADIDFLLGYMTTKIDEDLSISHTLSASGVTLRGTDVFETRNEFHGVQVGLMGNHDCLLWNFSALAKIGIGNMRQEVNIFGSEARVPPFVTSAGGLLALPSNIGMHVQDEFALVPECGVGLSYHLTEHTDLTVGYSFMYWNQVVLPGDQIDRAVNATQARGGVLTGEARPRIAFHETDFFVHGVNLGVHIRF